MDFLRMNKKSLLEGVKHWAKVERQATVTVLEFLAEIDRRRLYLEEGYASLHDFCVRYLAYSEGEAGRRMHAARCAAQFPAVKALLRHSRLSLSGVSLIAPHITAANAAEMLAQVAGRTTRGITRILVEKFGVPDRDVFAPVPVDAELDGLLCQLESEYGERHRPVLLKRLAREALERRNAQKERRRAKPAAGAREPAKHTRYVPQALRNALKTRAKNRCEYRSPTGLRCSQVAHLEVDHVRPWAKGGSSREAGNLRLLCKAHNLFLARRDFPDWKPASRARA